MSDTSPSFLELPAPKNHIGVKLKLVQHGTVTPQVTGPSHGGALVYERVVTGAASTGEGLGGGGGGENVPEAIFFFVG